MKKYKGVRLVPFNEKVEGGIYGATTTKRYLEILALRNTGSKSEVKNKLTKKQRDLFLLFMQEQQRLNKNAEVEYLKKYLADQRIAANKMAAYLKKRDAYEIKTYAKIPIFEDTKKYYSGAPISKFKITNDINDLRTKVNKLDETLFRLRHCIDEYEREDYLRWDRQNGGGWEERLKKRIRKQMRKVA